MEHIAADDRCRTGAWALEASGVGKSFDAPVLRGIDLTIARGEVLALLGPSGCGKTTLLRIAAGLLAPSSGRVSIDGVLVADGERHGLPPEARGIGMVFQDYALWPHLSVLANVAFPLRMRGVAVGERRGRAMGALERVGLAHLAQRDPGTLSGGQQQRVALARAIVAEPPLVLFDEPLSNLDRELRESLALEMGALLRELKLSAVYVTHDHAEAFTIADRVAVMLNGAIAQLDTPETLFTDPATPEVARFLNIGALIDGEVSARRFRCGTGAICVETPGEACADGPAQLLIPRTAVGPAADGPLEARVARCQFQGDRYLLHLELGSGERRLVCPSDTPARPGARIALALDRARLRLFPQTSQPLREGHAS
ncbi:ABC transporter ATP-binding protein [Salinarimonas chemoclinalis]|uniref:ABC transporter ATP-binding protein n=1 Tax=Salinarimonas chemoclinalis TaxID=3241599 RepID=UPI003558A088